jgi:hypothetical protein
MLGVANTLVAAILKTVKPQLPRWWFADRRWWHGATAAMIPGRTRGRWRLAAAAAALALLTGCSQAGARRAEPAPAASPSTSDQAAGGVEAAKGFRSVRGYRATPEPVQIHIPKIGVSNSLIRLGRASDGTVEVPKPFGLAGWYAPGTRPGDPGSAVILGHVDSKRGPAVFYRLRELRRSDDHPGQAHRRVGAAVRGGADRKVRQAAVPDRLVSVGPRRPGATRARRDRTTPPTAAMIPW